jgi:hypothetical protein
MSILKNKKAKIKKNNIIIRARFEREAHEVAREPT